MLRPYIIFLYGFADTARRVPTAFFMFTGHTMACPYWFMFTGRNALRPYLLL